MGAYVLNGECRQNSYVQMVLDDSSSSVADAASTGYRSAGRAWSSAAV